MGGGHWQVEQEAASGRAGKYYKSASPTPPPRQHCETLGKQHPWDAPFTSRRCQRVTPLFSRWITSLAHRNSLQIINAVAHDDI